MKNVFIIGHYGGNNLGDELMLESILESLYGIKNVDEIKVVAKKTLNQEKKVKFVPLNILALINALFSSQVLILGGGTHFHDDYTNERYRKHFVYLLKILVITLIFKLLGKKVVYMGMGFGPFKRRLTLILTKISLRLVDVITVRDHKSLERLNEKNISANNCHVNFDLVSMNPFLFKHKQKNEDSLGISMTSFEYSANNLNDSVWDELFPSLVEKYKTSQLTIKIFVFRSGNKESDLPLSQSLFKQLNSIDSKRVKLVTYSGNTKAFIDEMNSCSNFIATRYHSAVLAYLCNCRLLIIPYHIKLIDFAEHVQLDSYAILDHDKILLNFRKKFLELLESDDRFKPRFPSDEAGKLAENNVKILAEVFNESESK